MSGYSPAVLERFRRATGAGRIRSGDDVGTGEAVAPDGERIRLQLRLGADERIADARFKAFGCPVAIACGSYAAQRVIGTTRGEAAALGVDELEHELALKVEQRPIAALALTALAGALAELTTPNRGGTEPR